MGLREFAERTIRLRGQPFSLRERLYLHQIYRSTARNLVIRASRQVEKSTFLVNRLLYDAIREPGIQILFVCPRREQAHLFSHTRLAAAVTESDVLRRLLWPYRRPMPTENIKFANGSRVFIRAAFLSADACRGISADAILIDEFQDLAAGELPVLQETLSHASNPRTVLTGTPKAVTNHLEQSYAQSTAAEWLVPCSSCGARNRLDEKVLGPRSLICTKCESPLDVRLGCWVARNPDSCWGSGFWLNHLMASWLDYQEILDRQRTYDPAKFKNESLGLPTELGDHLVTREEVEAACDDRPFARSLADVPATHRPHVIGAVDWGGGGVAATVLALGCVERQRIFRVLRLDRWLPGTDEHAMMDQIAERCAQFRVRYIGGDGGGFGRSHNRLLLARLHDLGCHPHFYSIFYASSDQAPVPDGILWKWSVNRSASIGTMFGRIKKGLLRFPRVADSSSFLDEFVNEIAVYDDEMRSIKYTKPETVRDDAVHAVNYLELLGLRMVLAAG